MIKGVGDVPFTKDGIANLLSMAKLTDDGFRIFVYKKYFVFYSRRTYDAEFKLKTQLLDTQSINDSQIC